MTCRRGHERHTRDAARLESPPTLLGRGDDDLHVRNRTATRANDGITPYERFYGMKPDVGHIRTIVRVTLPSETLGK